MIRPLVAAVAAALALAVPASAAPDLPKSPVKVVRGSCPSGYYETGWIGPNQEYKICQR